MRTFTGNVLFEPALACPDEGVQRHGFGSVGFYISAVDKLPAPPAPIASPEKIRPPAWWPESLALSELGLSRFPRRGEGREGRSVTYGASHAADSLVDWAKGIRCAWEPGEDGAHAALERFVRGGVSSFEGTTPPYPRLTPPYPRLTPPNPP